MCKGGPSANGTYETPLIDRGRWQASPLWFRLEPNCELVLTQSCSSQIQLVFNDPKFVELNFFAKQGPDEILDSAGNRKGTFEIIVSVSKSDLSILWPSLTNPLSSTRVHRWSSEPPNRTTPKDSGSINPDNTSTLPQAGVGTIGYPRPLS